MAFPISETHDQEQGYFLRIDSLLMFRLRPTIGIHLKAEYTMQDMQIQLHILTLARCQPLPAAFTVLLCVWLSWS